MVTNEIWKAPGYLRSDSRSENVTWKSCIPKSRAMVTQMVRVQHAEIGISSPAVSLSSASLFLTMLPFCSSFYWFLGLIVPSLALCPCPWVQAILYALTGCGSPVGHSHIHWLTKAGLPERQSWVHSSSQMWSNPTLWLYHIKCQLPSLSNLLFPLAFHLSRFFPIYLYWSILGGCLLRIQHKTTKTAPKTYIHVTFYRLSILFMYLEIRIYICMPIHIHHIDV